jgi:hypothetical protein
MVPLYHFVQAEEAAFAPNGPRRGYSRRPYDRPSPPPPDRCHAPP